MSPLPVPSHNSRLGFHYFPDTLHYREKDLDTWLPELHAMGASWLTLVAPQDRSIPEAFLNGLISEGIEPILHYHFPYQATPALGDLRLLLNTYARWGVHYITLFDRPNQRGTWPAAAWTQNNLVERFLDLYMPLADLVQQVGMFPVFPPLEPGSDYWDTAFLRSALQGIQRRGGNSLLQNLVLGAYAWAGNRPLEWGAGGPERWPEARPYTSSEGVQDQRGFRIFDWYLALSQAAVGAKAHILLLGAGSKPGDQTDKNSPVVTEAAHAKTNRAIAQLMTALPGEAETADPVPDEVLACNFWLLSANMDSPYSAHSWFQADGEILPAANVLRSWWAERFSTHTNWMKSKGLSGQVASSSINGYPISHYLLLPAFEWGVTDWHQDIIRPFVKKYRPTVGYSAVEAAYARRVTVIGGPQDFSEDVIEGLRRAGCKVDVISGDGTRIASQLAVL